MAVFDVVGYAELIQQQPGFLQDYPKFNEWLEQYSGLSTDNQQTVIDIVDAMSIDNASGDVLNKLGELVGIKRNQIILDSGDLIDDENYKKVIKGKIAQNYWDGTLEGFEDILNLVFDTNFQFLVVDNQDMSVDVFIFGTYTALDEELLTKGYYTPKAMGVNVDYFKLAPVSFGWDLDTVLIKGFDEGSWSEAI